MGGTAREQDGLMQYARQLDLDTVRSMLDENQFAKVMRWLRQSGVGVALYSGDSGERHLLTFGNRIARIPNRWPPAFYGTWPIYGFIPPGTTVPVGANETMSRPGPDTDGKWR
jgi:hypothetical protein